MSLKNDVLAQLQRSGEKYISGEELAKKFGKSRAAVWKAVRALKKEGYIIDAVTNKGYILTADNDLLSAEAVSQFMKHNIEVIYYPSVDSTNTQAKRLINEGKNGTMLITAEQQTAGRGRQGKSFYSPPGTGIYMSLVIHPDISLQNAVTATTAASVAVCRAVEKLTEAKPRIKWVNDVYIGDHKICGILTEAVTDFETGTVSSVIVGIGMNITTVKFPEDVENAGALGEKVGRSALIAAIADELIEIAFGEYSDFIDYYRSRSMIIGEKINYIENGRVTAATALSIDEKGGLVIENEAGEKLTLRSGEISIRKRT